MSAPRDTTNGDDNEKSSRSQNNRFQTRRRPVGGRKNDDEDAEEQEVGGGDASTAAASGDKPRRKITRAVDFPVPPELIGQEVTGKIFDIVKRYSGSYGFILINSETSPKNQKPKIYFNMKDYEETDFIARKGYEIKLTVSKDERDRLCATNIHLTPDGRVAAGLREERILKYKEEEAAAGGSGSGSLDAKQSSGSSAARGTGNAGGEGAGDRKKRAPRVRREPNETSVPLKVTCDDSEQTVTVDAKIFQSIGRLKHSCVEAFGLPMQYSIYCNRTSANPEGELLTKMILKAMKEGDAIHLGPLVAMPAVEETEA